MRKGNKSQYKINLFTSKLNFFLLFKTTEFLNSFTFILYIICIIILKLTLVIIFAYVLFRREIASNYNIYKRLYLIARGTCFHLQFIEQHYIGTNLLQNLNMNYCMIQVLYAIDRIYADIIIFNYQRKQCEIKINFQSAYIIYILIAFYFNFNGNGKCQIF